MSTADSRSASTPTVGAMLSRSTVRVALAIFQHQYHLDEGAAFDVLKDVSQRHNVKLRSVAAGLISPDNSAQPRSGTVCPPLPFTIGGRACTNRSDVLTALMRQVIIRSGAGRGTVQLCDRVHGGLQIEGRHGFSQAFADTFSYVGGTGTSCGHAFSDGSQVVVGDVDRSALFSASARETLLKHCWRTRSAPAFPPRLSTTTAWYEESYPRIGVAQTAFRPKRSCARFGRWPASAVAGCSGMTRWCCPQRWPRLTRPRPQGPIPAVLGRPRRLTRRPPLPMRPGCSPSATASSEVMPANFSLPSPLSAVSHFMRWPLKCSSDGEQPSAAAESRPAWRGRELIAGHRMGTGAGRHSAINRSPRS